MRPFLNITKALSDESRVRMLLALRSGELCVCWVIELLGLAPSTVSKHMTILAQADLVQCRKDGRWHYFRLPDAEGASPLVRSTLEWLDRAAGNYPIAVQDAKRLKEIRKNGKAAMEAGSCCRK
jgi:DNA-binding transcriptional ArsR family regulator